MSADGPPWPASFQQPCAPLQSAGGNVPVAAVAAAAACYRVGSDRVEVAADVHVYCTCALHAEQLYSQLEDVRGLLIEVSKMSTLVSLVKAAAVREDFLRTNRDLMNTFFILAQGEQLLVSTGHTVCGRVNKGLVPACSRPAWLCTAIKGPPGQVCTVHIAHGTEWQ
jgi:hypothetical protein